MPFLSRKRKRPAIEEEVLEEVETGRTVDESITSLSNFNVSSSQNGFNRINIEEEEVEEAEEAEQRDEDMSNNWADDVNTSYTELSLTFTQMQRDFGEQVVTETERAQMNVAETGSIESITLHNFMCHSNFHLDFGIYFYHYWYLLYFN